ncbi:MAG: histidine kinase [Bacteroidales bacterium]|nr:histidine kinase [Bacteroidales bacterium]
MYNPLYGNRSYFFLYSGIWALIAFIHLFILTFYHAFGIEIALAEAFVGNFFVAILGLSLWFPVFYISFRKSNILFSIFQQILICIIASGLSFGIIYLFLASTFHSNKEYLLYLKSSIPWRMIAGLMYYFIVILLYNLIIYYQNFKEKAISEGELKALVKDSELSSLKSQINPHFLFNSLNSISSLTIISPEKAREMIIKLSEFLRYSLSKDDEQLTTLEQEINNINRYLDIEKVRFGAKLNIVKNIGENCLPKKLPWLILQPVVENAIKYGVYENIEESLVELSCWCTDDVLRLSIKNNYDSELIVNKGEGIGLQNIRRRLKLIYNSDSLLKIVNSGGIFEVIFTFPQNSD